MEVGVNVWVRDKIGLDAWLPGCIQSKKKTDDGKILLIVFYNEADTESFIIDNDFNYDIPDLKLRNSDADSGVEDLINLPFLHEPAILCCLENRYGDGQIYTYTGPILIAVNPFKKVDLYTSQILEKYYNSGLLRSQGIESTQHLEPHVYAIADAAYRNMMRGIQSTNSSSNSNCDQVILISGESGAGKLLLFISSSNFCLYTLLIGKTESTKIVLRYLTIVGSPTGRLELSQGSVMDKILQSNPILEAFGNAKTIRNDNSSRFGKFIELNFNRRGHLVGGKIRTYLLEKVRLPSQQLGERNFHIFYQMASGGSKEELLDWGIDSIEEFKYTNQGNIFKLKHVNDHEEFQIMKSALSTLNFSNEQQIAIMKIMAGLLHLGEIEFVPDSDGEGSDVSFSDRVLNHLQKAADLIGIDMDALIYTLTVRIISTRNESYEKKLTPAQAENARDAMTKAIYGKIFLSIVDIVNLSIQVDAKLVRSDVGVLDIFGFECFKQNSFEQLCINYTNETLQQQFNQFVFKMEQTEYQREKIEWSFVEFPDNQDCLDLIEHKTSGILAMIDDECKLPKATDEKLAGRMYKAFENSKRFTSNAAQRRDFLFCVHHYAGPVVYNVITFVEKNKDELPKETFSLLNSSSHKWLASLFDSSEAKKAQGTGPTPISSVGSQFKEQLSSLMKKIYATSPHYIRCLKPNDLNVPDNFNRIRTTEQLRYGGVLEAVRVARSGFPVRLPHAEFYTRYRPLGNPFDASVNKLPRVLPANSIPRALCEGLITTFYEATTVQPSTAQSRKVMNSLEWLGKFDIPKDSIQLGNTKVFLRKTAHDLLEARRSRRMVVAARIIQSMFRCYVAVKMLQIYKAAVLRIQCAARVFLAYKIYMFKKSMKAATNIQRYYRRYHCKSMYFTYKFAVIRLQSRFRARICRKKFRNDLLFKRAVISLQCKLRCIVAKRVYRQLKLEARDIGKLKQSNESLKQEIEMLRAKAVEFHRHQDDIAREKELQTLQATLEETKLALSKERILRQEAEEKLKDFMENNADSDFENYRIKLEVAESKFLELEASGKEERIYLEEELKKVISENSFLKISIAKLKSGVAINSDVVNSDVEDMTSKIHSITIGDGSVLDLTESPMRSTKSDGVDSQFVKDLESKLSEQKVANNILEEEVSRLRLMSMELNAQLDSMRRNISNKQDIRHSKEVSNNAEVVLMSAKKDIAEEKVRTLSKSQVSSDVSLATAHGGISANAIDLFEKNLENLRAKLIKVDFNLNLVIIVFN